LRHYSPESKYSVLGLNATFLISWFELGMEHVTTCKMEDKPKIDAVLHIMKTKLPEPDSRMSTLYKVTEVEGKGLGCIALEDIKKGSLILREMSQCHAGGSHSSLINNRSTDLHEVIVKVMKSVLTSYQKMSSSDKKEYLKLYNIVPEVEASQGMKGSEMHSILDFYEIALAMHPDLADIPMKKKKSLEVMQIYRSNALDFGLGIKTSRFNHSCCANAQWIEIDMGDQELLGPVIEITAVRKIKAGEEITINYNRGYLAMQNQKVRQEYLLSCLGFNCYCNICKDETDDDGKYEEFQLLKLQVEKLTATKAYKKSDPKLIKKEVFLYKEMYKLAKEKRAPHAYILKAILGKGLTAARYGHSLSKESKMKDEFKKDFDNFSRVGHCLVTGISKGHNFVWEPAQLKL